MLHCVVDTHAQQVLDENMFSNWKISKIPATDTLDISNLNIIEWQTLQVIHATATIDTPVKIVRLSNITSDSIIIKYRKSPIPFNVSQSKKSLQAIDSNVSFGHTLVYHADSANLKGFVKFNGLEYNGSYARSLQVGNSQDVTLNSNFNINLNGYILDSVRVEAAITDNTIPFQTDGNTYQLQEFDKLYITFEKRKHKLTAGDFNMLAASDNYFLKYNKRVQGLNFQSTFDLSPNVQNTVNFSGSIAKGQFVRNVFNGKEGNQGPYKLTGSSGEVAFVVLAGTEKVYIDGQLMQRGQDRDYIINYNTAEITFMPRQMITKDKRIQVEFEYQDRNYLNSLFHVQDQLKVGKKLALNFNLYSNQDAKNQPYLQTIGTEERSFLRDIGDSIQRAYFNTRSIDTFTEKEILYRISSVTIGNLVFDTVYVQSSNNDSVLYNLNFTNVGNGNGNYIISDKNINGRVYEWIAPVDGKPQGAYEPVILLITPKKHQVYSLGLDYQIDTNNVVKVEGAVSNYDPNLFAPNQGTDHYGNAIRVDFKNVLPIKKDTLGTYVKQLTNQVYFERVAANFKSIAPYRNVEFARDWNVDTTKKASEILLGYKAVFSHKEKYAFNYDFDYYDRNQTLQGQRHILAAQWQYKRLNIQAVGNITLSKDTSYTNVFWRPKLTIEQRIKGLSDAAIGVSYAQEANQFNDIVTDTLTNSSYKFNVYSVFLKNGPNAKNKFDINYRLRTDDSIYQYNRLTRGNTSQELNANVSVLQLKNQVINLMGTYRVLNVANSRGNLESANSIVSRIEHSGTFAKKIISTNTLYEIGTGQEQKREYTYVEVDAGLGMYMWVDYNQDGIQQMNEFEIAVYNDQKRFIRVINPTNEYINVNYMTLNQSIQLQAENRWRNSKQKGLKLLSKFSDQFTAQVNNRAYQDAGLSVYNPFGITAEESIIAANTSITNALYYNRINPRFGVDYTTQYFTGKTLMTYGIETSKQQRNIVKSRIGFTKNLTMNLNGTLGSKSYMSGFIDERSYNIHIQSIEPSLTWLTQSRVRFTGLYRFETRQNANLYGGELAAIHNLGVESKLSLRKSGTFNIKMTYTQIDYNGLPNTSKTYAILESLKNGNNWIWYFNWDVRVGKNIEMSLNYEGRKTGTDRVIHTGNMSIRALLN